MCVDDDTLAVPMLQVLEISPPQSTHAACALCDGVSETVPDKLCHGMYVVDG